RGVHRIERDPERLHAAGRSRGRLARRRDAVVAALALAQLDEEFQVALEDARRQLPGDRTVEAARARRAGDGLADVDVVELAGAAAQVQAREDRPRLPVGRDAPVGLQQRVAILDQPRGPLLDRDQLTVGDDLDRDALVDLDTIDTDVAAGPLRRVEGHEGRRRI